VFDRIVANANIIQDPEARVADNYRWYILAVGGLKGMHRILIRLTQLAAMMLVAGSLLWSQTPPALKTVDEVLERYKRALGGVAAIRKVKSETRRGEIDVSGTKDKATFISYSKPFKSLFKLTRADGREMVSGFDGAISWSVTPEGAQIDKDIPVESNRRDTDLYYPLHQPDYFQKLEFAGITGFEGRPCYWLHGTTHWGKDNNQFYDAETGLLAGYRFQSDSSASAVVVTALFQDYKNFGGPLIATKNITRVRDRVQTLAIQSVSYEPLADSIFDLPQAVKALLN
jgi:hypothetical protein